MPSKIYEVEVSAVAIVGQRWQASLEAQRKSPRTIESYLAAVDALSNFLSRAGMPTIITGIRREHVESFISARLRETTVRGKPRSANSVGIEYRSLRVFFNYAIDEGEIRESPMAKMHPPKADEPTTPLVDEAAMRKLMKVTDGDRFEARRDRALILLLLDCGLRRAEIAGLTVDAVDFDGTPPFVRVIGKGRKERHVPFGPITAQALSRYLRKRQGHRSAIAGLPDLWLGMAGPMTASGLYQIVVDRARQAGLPKLHPHQFRHSFAHQYLARGGQEGDLMRLAGWTSDVMVRRYGKSGADERARAAYVAHSPVEGLLGKKVR